MGFPESDGSEKPGALSPTFNMVSSSRKQTLHLNYLDPFEVDFESVLPPDSGALFPGAFEAFISDS